MLDLTAHATPAFGTPFEKGVDRIVFASRKDDPNQTVKFVSKGQLDAVIVPPTNRQKFMLAANALSPDEKARISENCEDYLFRKSKYLGYNHERKTFSTRVSAADIERIGPFFKTILKTVSPYVFAAIEQTKNTFFCNNFIAEKGEVSDYPTMHRDPLTVHLSVQGAPLEFLAGKFGEHDIKGFLDSDQTDPRILSKLRSVQQGDTVIFSEKFWHRSSHQSKELGQFSLAYWEH